MRLKHVLVINIKYKFRDSFWDNQIWGRIKNNFSNEKRNFKKIFRAFSNMNMEYICPMSMMELKQYYMLWNYESPDQHVWLGNGYGKLMDKPESGK